MIARIAIILLLATCKALPAEWQLRESQNVTPSFSWKTVAADRQVALGLVMVDVRRQTLRVIDNIDGRGNLRSAMEAEGCQAGVNGGYFHPDRTPLGLVISDGKLLHGFERARLLSGLVVVTRSGQISLLRAAAYKPAPNIWQALQAGPFLVDGGKPVVGLNSKTRAERTAVLSDNAGLFALLKCGSVTLAELAEILSNPKVISELRVRRALNLDGGSSSGMWVRGEARAFYHPELKTVRNYLAVVWR